MVNTFFPYSILHSVHSSSFVNFKSFPSILKKYVRCLTYIKFSQSHHFNQVLHMSELYLTKLTLSCIRITSHWLEVMSIANVTFKNGRVKQILITYNFFKNLFPCGLLVMMLIASNPLPGRCFRTENLTRNSLLAAKAIDF